ncbi:MAG: SpoIIE family protein phosphatase [Kiritimatiellia bacterium]|jgi:serine phosphatase RsbU (regulator of sigma subunit)|nr:SpoIIE family protein phosphatase [Kiritimatiellia bacterium]
MRTTFQKWLFLFVALAFLVTFGVSFFIETRQARNNAVGLIRLKMEDARRQIGRNRENVATIREIADATALAKARAFAKMIAQQPSVLTSREELEDIRERLDVDELHVSDEKGILIASIPAAYEGYDMASSAQSAAFVAALRDPAFALAQEPKAKGINGEIFQYAGVARVGRPGIVQIGYHPRRLQKAMEVAAIENLAAGFRIGKGGRILVGRAGRIVSIDDRAFLGKSLAEYGFSAGQLAGDAAFAVTLQGVKHIGLAQRGEDFTLVGILPQAEMYVGRNEMGAFLIVCNLILFAVVFALVSVLVQRVVIDGIHSVNRSLDKITRGDLGERVEVRTNREFIALSEGINATVTALKQAIREAAARIDAELEFARTIQQSSLPTVFPPYPDRPEFDIYATMHTAKEVGGDFYDFFLLGERRLAVLIADVSGKGIPAALFMMTTKTLIQNLAESGLPPAGVFTEANRHLCANNETMMFVTAFMGILELDTGTFSFVNAGHNPPLLKRAGHPYAVLRTRPGLVLGGMDGTAYSQDEFTFGPGDKLFLYTDGVTEALNPEQALFSERRLEATLNGGAARDMDVTRLLRHIKQEIDRFAEGAEQADDITLLALEYKGRERS